MDLKNKIFISYGTDKYDPSRVKPIDVNSIWGKSVNKPHGGLWGSPIDSNFGWGDFCNRDAFNLKTLSKHFLFKLKKDSKICIIDTVDDLVRNSVYDKVAWQCILDIKNIVKNYDGIYVSEGAAAHLRHSVKLRDGLYVSGLNTWDVESICVWNASIIEPLEEDAFEKSSYHKYEKPLYTPDDEFYYYGFDKLKDRNALQFDADFERYRNTNVEDSRKLFKGEHPALLAQKHGNSKDAKLARKFNGTIKSGINEKKSNNMNNNMIKLTESDLHRIIKESVKNIINELDSRTYHSAAMKDYDPDRGRKFQQMRNKNFNDKYAYHDEKGNEVSLHSRGNELILVIRIKGGTDREQIYFRYEGDENFHAQGGGYVNFPNVMGDRKFARVLSKVVAAFDNMCSKYKNGAYDDRHQEVDFHKFLGKKD